MAAAGPPPGAVSGGTDLNYRDTRHTRRGPLWKVRPSHSLPHLAPHHRTRCPKLPKRVEGCQLMGPWLDRRVTGSCVAPSREQQGPREERPPVLGPGMGVQRKGQTRSKVLP